MKKHLIALGLLFLLWNSAQAAPCSQGATNCTTDTATDQTIVNAIGDPTLGDRVLYLFNGQCSSVYDELNTTTGHTFRVNKCLNITNGGIPLKLLVSALVGVDSNLQAQIVCGLISSPAGCFVDADAVQAIATLLTVTANTASTTASTFDASTTATASSGSPVLTVVSGSGVLEGMFASAAGVPTSAYVVNVSGTTVTMSQSVTAALSATPIFFYQNGVTQFSVASATGIVVGAAINGAGFPANSLVQAVSGTTITSSLPITTPLLATPVLFTLYTGWATR